MHASPNSLPKVRPYYLSALTQPVTQCLLVTVLLLVSLIAMTRPAFHGDAAEYTLMTVSLARHGSAEVTQADAQAGKTLSPGLWWHHDQILGYFSSKNRLPSGFLLGKDGKVHEIHTFGYSALAAIPFKVLQFLGSDPMKCFLWVDASAIFILALSSFFYFGTPAGAFLTLCTFATTVGFAYWNWASPELFSSALSLSALLLMARRSYIPAGILIGLAGMQNPPLLALLFLGPVITVSEFLATTPGSRLGPVLTRQHLYPIAVGTITGLVIGLSPIFFSLKFFGTWNVIAADASDPRLVSLLRLFSYYTDLNQGMLVAVPGIWLATIVLIMRKKRLGLVLVPVLLTSLALAIPTLTTQNWNSGASGIMRYVTWGATPFLFLFLACAREINWNARYTLALAFALQIFVVTQEGTYPHTDFSPMAYWALRHVPQYYNPEPEIFMDRTSHSEAPADYDRSYSFGSGARKKTLFYAGSLKSIFSLCPQSLPVRRPTVKASYDGWTYFNGEIECERTKLGVDTFGIAQISKGVGAKVSTGWSIFEFGADGDGGIWSIGKESRLVVPTSGRQIDAISFEGNYMGGNSSTEVLVDGRHVGSVMLDRPNRIQVEPAPRGDMVTITLRHRSPKKPSLQDQRDLSFFLRRISMSYRLPRDIAP